MKRPTFLEGVWVALIASMFGAAVFTVPATLFAASGMHRLVIAGLGLAYVLYLLARSPERVGRVTVIAGWLVVAAVIWWLALPLLVYVMAHVGMIWLIRSLYFHASALSALADLGLNGLALAAALWAGIQTHSLWLGIWCFFLVQALFVAIPPHWRRLKPGQLPTPVAADHFESAHQVAESALRKFSSIR
ncbi:MAG: hypothetical protein OEQ18_16505 [Gammaproteobacteria bacterium]|nr:hypothetical protein [Gammaproteobacteria bacterium]